MDTHKYNPGELKVIWSANDEKQFFKKIIQVITQEKLEILHFHYAIPFAKIMLQVKSFFEVFLTSLKERFSKEIQENLLNFNNITLE